MDQLTAFIGVSLIVIVTPGPDTALILRNTLGGGRDVGFASALGIATGQVLWALAASLGLAALLVASEPLFVAVKLAGAAYLIVLGAQALIAALRSAPAGAETAPDHAQRLSRSAGFRRGLISNLGNPKMAAFFTSLFPQFTPAHGGAFATLFALGLVFAALTAVWLSVYTIATGALSRTISTPRVRRWIDAVTGTVLIALGVRIASEGRS